jgi:hypothetical protein
VVRPEEVLESLKNDGSIDALRMKIIAQLKANVRAGFPSSPDSPPIPLRPLFCLLLTTIFIMLEVFCCMIKKHYTVPLKNIIQLRNHFQLKLVELLRR